MHVKRLKRCYLRTHYFDNTSEFFDNINNDVEMPQVENLTTVNQDNGTNNHNAVNRNQGNVMINPDSTMNR